MILGPSAGPHPATLPPDRLLADCDVRFSRRSGPGGQNRNKVETAAILTHRPSGLSAEANERRSQGQNRAVALARLRVILALEIRHPADPGAGPSPLWTSRLRGGRLVVSPEHDDFPALLAEALDVLSSLDFDVKAASEALGCSASQLVKFLKREPRALKQTNDRRSDLGLRPLR
ncbi:peptide chain release factor family protein [Tautonia sociabilis]|uniref:Peptide chain release factor-like protein n=1 Tax=Tautonia sociabilis TaxID=2080755 RepID=A0A432MKV1_9BACT|nr:peptide chain release factor-like protein [Tautonia sociabilis]RUL87837.1 peptide chain release factor-like protein [Tautonia sociabilis]